MLFIETTVCTIRKHMGTSTSSPSSTIPLICTGHLLLHSNFHIYPHLFVKCPSSPLDQQDKGHGSHICFVLFCFVSESSVPRRVPEDRRQPINVFGLTFSEVCRSHVVSIQWHWVSMSIEAWQAPPQLPVARLQPSAGVDLKAERSRKTPGQVHRTPEEDELQGSWKNQDLPSAAKTHISAC